MSKEPSATVQFAWHLWVWTNPFVPFAKPCVNLGIQCRPRFFTDILWAMWSQSTTNRHDQIAFRSSVILANILEDPDLTEFRSGMIMVYSLHNLIWLLFRRSVISVNNLKTLLIFFWRGVISVCICSLQHCSIAVISGYSLKTIIRLLSGSVWSPTIVYRPWSDCSLEAVWSQSAVLHTSCMNPEKSTDTEWLGSS